MHECSACGIAKPPVEFRHRRAKPISVCKSCEREKQREYYWRNPAHGRAKAAKSMRKLRSDPMRVDALRAKAREHYHAKGKHTERVYHQRIKAETPWRWRARNAKRNCSEFITEEWLRDQFARQDGCCALTGRPIAVETFEIDHIIPRSRGGGDELVNLRLLCSEANQAKGNMLDAEFRALCEEMIGRAILEAINARH